MRRQLRRRTLRALLCLLLASGVVFLWVRSNRRTDLAGVFTPGGYLQAAGSHRGTLLFFVGNVSFRDDKAFAFEYEQTYPRAVDQVIGILTNPQTRTYARFGFAVTTGPGSSVQSTKGSYALITIPNWLPLGLLIVAAGQQWWGGRRRIARWRREGRCLQCGYDLRENSGRCPECGAAVTAAPVAGEK